MSSEIKIGQVQVFEKGSDEFQCEQKRLIDSAGGHLKKACIAGVATGLAMMATPTGAVMVVEVIHQSSAAALDLGKYGVHERMGKVSVKPQ